MGVRCARVFGCLLLATMAASAETKKPADQIPPVHHGSESVADCLERWDAGTHMTKSQWRKTCERVRAERLPYLKANRHTD